MLLLLSVCSDGAWPDGVRLGVDCGVDAGSMFRQCTCSVLLLLGFASFMFFNVMHRSVPTGAHQFQVPQSLLSGCVVSEIGFPQGHTLSETNRRTPIQ